MSQNKLVNSLSYLSIIFAPFIFPFIVWLVTRSTSDMHETAKHAFLLHLTPVVLTILTFMMIGVIGVAVKNSQFTGILATTVLILVGVIDLGVSIYSLYLGIKILVSDK